MNNGITYGILNYRVFFSQNFEYLVLSSHLLFILYFLLFLSCFSFGSNLTDIPYISSIYSLLARLSVYGFITHLVQDSGFFPLKQRKLLFIFSYFYLSNDSFLSSAWIHVGHPDCVARGSPPFPYHSPLQFLQRNMPSECPRSPSVLSPAGPPPGFRCLVCF